MKKAIEKGWEGVEKHQEPFGACIVKGDIIISLCHNTVNSDKDLTAHAEINAIKDACIKLGTDDLSDCDIYATFKPCQMCQEACKRVKIRNIYYGAGPEDVEYPRSDYFLHIESGILRDLCLELVSKKYRPN